MKKLLEVIKEAEAQDRGIGHFNIADTAALNAIVAAAEETKLPVIIGTSEGEAEFFGARRAALLVRALREEQGLPVYLNADHFHSLEKIKEAVAAGYDMVIFDGSKLPLEENIARTKEAVEYVRSANPDVLVEGELGYIGSGSEVHAEVPEGAAVRPEDLTTPEDAARFVRETGVDLFAPAVGNLHGTFKNAPNPALDIERIRAIKEATGTPLVLHGGSGVSDPDFKAAIAAGMNIVHENTELRVAWRRGLEESLKDLPDEVAPYKLLARSMEGIKEVVARRMRLFAGQ
jgi:fructose-bisphosphate aldolase class II